MNPRFEERHAMEALTKFASGHGGMELRTAGMPEVGNGDVLIRVGAAGICGTDLHIFEDRFPCTMPVILGHEFAGEIVKVGGSVTRYAVGDHVVAEPHRGGCGHCRYCLNGSVEVCEEKKAIGYRVDGCFASHLALPATSLHRISADVPFKKAAVAEPLAVVVKGVLERSRVEPEDFVVVLGCGPIGLLAAAVAKAEGARTVLVTGTDLDEKVRLEAARKMGIDHTVNVQRENLVDKVKALTRGLGADLVVEASGAAPAVRQAFEVVRRDGRVCALGLTGKDEIQVPWDTAIRKAAHVSCSYSSSWTSWERAVSIIESGKVDLDPLVTHVLPLAEWEHAFDQLRNLSAIKAVLVP
jgi:L-iditol 2-dehydrogenase